MWTASKLSRNCAAHHALSDLNPRPTRDAAAKKGQHFHRALEEWRDTGAVPFMADDDIAAWLGTMVDKGWDWPDGCELEVAWGLDPWGCFQPVRETDPHVYVSITGDDLMTAGRCDGIWPSGDMLVVVDWKTGRFDAPHISGNLQVNAAGMALCQRHKKAGYIPCLYYARDGRWQPGEEVMAGSEKWNAMLDEIKRAAALDDQPHPGDWCNACWERKSCGASRQVTP